MLFLLSLQMFRPLPSSVEGETSDVVLHSKGHARNGAPFKKKTLECTAVLCASCTLLVLESASYKSLLQQLLLQDFASFVSRSSFFVCLLTLCVILQHGDLSTDVCYAL